MYPVASSKHAYCSRRSRGDVRKHLKFQINLHIIHLTCSTSLWTFPTRAASICNRFARSFIFQCNQIDLVAGFFRGCIAANISEDIYAPAGNIVLRVCLSAEKRGKTTDVSDERILLARYKIWNLTSSTLRLTFLTRAATICNRFARSFIPPCTQIALVAGFFRILVAANISAPADNVTIKVWVCPGKNVDHKKSK